MNRQIFNIKHPIIQAPMAGGILSPEFITKVCNHGLLGFIPAGYLSLDQLDEFIYKVKQNLSSINLPFGVNLFLEEQRVNDQVFDKPEYYQALEKELGFESRPVFNVPKSIVESDYIDLLIKHSVPIVSCTFGVFSTDSIERLKKHNIKIIGNVTSVAEFESCYNNKADAIVIQGTEAGGHQASFLTNNINLNPTLELLKQVRTLNQTITLIAAGGISYKNYKEYFKYGADYVQLGTSFMMTYESNLPLTYKEFILKSKHLTTLTSDITGKWARGVKNELCNLTQNHCEYPFPYQHYLTTYLRQQAKLQHNPEYASLWGGSNEDNYVLCSLDELIAKLKV